MYLLVKMSVEKRSIMKKALLIVDMQNDFVTGTLGNKECQQVVAEVVDILENSDDYTRIYITQDTHDSIKYMHSQEGRKLPVMHCDPMEGDGWNIVPDIKEKLDGMSTIKMYFNKNTFASIQLAQTVAKDYENDVFEELDIVGVCTGICVISNATIIKAYSTELPINIIERATACVTPESKKTAIDAMKLLQMNIVE